MAKHDAVTTHEHELAEYLQERIKPGLNRGAIPLLARSIAKEIVRREHLNGGSDDPELDGEYHENPDAEADDEPDLEAGGEDDVEAEADDDSDAEVDAGADDEPDAEADHEPTAEADEEPDDDSESPLDEFEAEMHELQAELGEDWIVRFSVQGDDAWLTAEKQDGSQHVEAPTAEVLAEAVELLNESGGRSGKATSRRLSAAVAPVRGCSADGPPPARRRRGHRGRSRRISLCSDRPSVSG